MIKAVIKRAMSASRKPGWKVFGEVWAPFVALDCWLQCRPLHVCAECNEWMPRWHYHGPQKIDTEANRQTLKWLMQDDPDFGRAMMDILRDDADFADFLVQKYRLAKKPEIERKYPAPPTALKNHAMIDPAFGRLWGELADGAGE